MKKQIGTLLISGFICLSLGGCWVVAGAAGAEAGYIGAQDNRSTGQTIDDQAIVAKIKTKMIADPVVSALSINVDSFKSDVTLRGYVKTEAEIDRAIEISKGTSGVRSVESKIVLDK